MSAPSRIPGAVIAAAVLAAVGVLPLVLVAFAVVALGGLEADTGRDSATVVLLVIPPFLQLFALGWLLLRRGRVPLVVSALVVVAVAVLVVGTATSVGRSVGAGPFVLAVFPVLAAAVAMSPAVGRWSAEARAHRRRRAG
jgi:peptidoglycan/LPS O-acetylase OafA/YrhL